MSAKYAIIKTGGKQYRVAENDIIDVELLTEQQGENVVFGDVLFVQNGSAATVGKPTVAGTVVKGQVLNISRGPKIMSVKYKASHNVRKTFGHRQHYTRVKITAIGA